MTRHVPSRSFRFKTGLFGSLMVILMAGGIDVTFAAFAQRVTAAPSIHQGEIKDSTPAFSPSIQSLVLTKTGVIYAGSFGMGVFRSQDEGQTWEALNTGLTDLFLLCLTVDGKGRVYAGTVMGGVFRLNQSLTRWERITDGLKRAEVRAFLAFDGKLYAGTGRGVYQWLESDRRWRKVAHALDQLLVYSLAVLDDQMLLAATAGKGLFQFDLHGSDSAEWENVASTFQDTKEQLTHRYLRIVVVNPAHHIFLGTQDGGIFRSVDGGESWQTLSRTLPNDSIRGIVLHQTGIFVGTGNGIYRMKEGERRWRAVNAGLRDLSIQTLILSSQGVLYAGTSAGIFRSRDVGSHWENVSEGLGTYTKNPQPYR